MYLPIHTSTIQVRLASRAGFIITLGLAAGVTAVSRRRRECLRELFYSHGLRFISNKYKETWVLFMWIWKILQKGMKSISVLKENIPVIRG
jgi:hypothetical protein